MLGVKLADSKQRPHFGDSRQYCVPVTFSPSHLQPESPQGGGDPAAQTFLPNAKALLSSPCLGFPRLRLICRRRLFQRICLPSFSPSPTAPSSAPPLSPSTFLPFYFILASSFPKTQADTISIIVLAISQWMKHGSRQESRGITMFHC